MNPQSEAELSAKISRLQALNTQVWAARMQSLQAVMNAEKAVMGVEAGRDRTLSALGIAHDIAPAAAQNAVPPAGSSYIDQMHAAGYDLSPEQYANLKILGVTPEYAQQMQKLGLGKPSPGDLIAMKLQGITPEYVEKLRSAGLEPHSVHEIIDYQMFNVSPEYLAAMRTAGFQSLSPRELVELRAQGVAPEYAAAMKKQFPNLTMGELLQLRIFKIDDAFIAEAKRHNFDPLTVQKLVRLRISGLLNDSASNSDKK
jgi:hypothetical protein